MYGTILEITITMKLILIWPPILFGSRPPDPLVYPLVGYDPSPGPSVLLHLYAGLGHPQIHPSHPPHSPNTHFSRF
jgi:hypothetical protein